MGIELDTLKGIIPKDYRIVESFWTNKLKVQRKYLGLFWITKLKSESRFLCELQVALAAEELHIKNLPWADVTSI